jgi:hypothetical protein
MAYFKLTAFDAVAGGILKASEIEDARAMLPEAVYRELYLAEPSDDGGNPFGVDAVQACIAPKSDKPPACFGVDLAKSVDWTWVVGLDAAGVQCVSERWQSDWNQTTSRVIDIVGRRPALVDSTGNGDPIVEGLQRPFGGYKTLTTGEVVRTKELGGPNFEGFKFSSSSKQQLMEGLASAIHRREVKFYDPLLVNELEAFEYEYTRTGVRYSAPEGLHDDGVCALALAVARKGRRTLHLDFSQIEVGFG